MHRAFRIKNLGIILLTQWATWYLIFKRTESKLTNVSGMSYVEMTILSIITCLLAIGAYLINDVYDQEADKHNGLNRVNDKKKTLLTYWFTNLIGLILSIYLAYSTQSLGLLWIYPTAVLVLYLYSRLLKGTPLMGNSIVALFCAMVPGILFLAERNMINEWKALDAGLWEFHKEILWMLVLFSFLSTIYREQVKDLEDLYGDKAAGYLTLPVVYGESRARALSIFSGIMFTVSVSIYAYYHHGDSLSYTFLTILLVLLLISIILLSKRPNRAGYTASSKVIKYAMLIGLVYILMPVLTQ